ncbi:hypothetical protein XM57_25575 [Burkholderia cepacia]|nr:hypothetical protein XM57_25575 [Burkholderia cepacia]
MACDGDAVVGHRVIAIDDQIGFDVAMQRACHLITFACDKSTFETHGLGCADYHATVIGRVSYTNWIHHFFIPSDGVATRPDHQTVAPASFDGTVASATLQSLAGTYETSPKYIIRQF